MADLDAGNLALDEEDELYIQSIVKDSQLLRIPETKSITIRVADHNLLGKIHSALPLSAGEQNLLSLSFELLKAKNENEWINHRHW